MAQRRPRERVTYRQLCVIAREQLTADLTIDDAEWKARIQDRLIALGFALPDLPDQLPRAMSAVEKALERECGPRPVPVPPVPIDPRPPSPLTRTDVDAAIPTIRQLDVNSPPPGTESSPSPRLKSVSGLVSLADILHPPPPRPPGLTTAEQMAAHRAEERTRRLDPLYLPTAHGWVKVADGKEPV